VTFRPGAPLSRYSICMPLNVIPPSGRSLGYPGDHPHTFPGGTGKRVAVDISGGPYIDLEREAQAMLARE
jgi:hypothetical protein